MKGLVIGIWISPYERNWGGVRRTPFDRGVQLPQTRSIGIRWWPIVGVDVVYGWSADVVSAA